MDDFVDEGTSKGLAGLSVSGMELISEKNLDGDQGRSAKAGPMSETATDPFEEGEQTLTRPDYNHQADLGEPGEDLEWEEVGRTEEASDCSEVETREELVLKGTSKSETKSNRWGKEESSLVKQGKNAMMSSISSREELPNSKAMKNWKTLYDECIKSFRSEGLSEPDYQSQTSSQTVARTSNPPAG